MKLVWFIGLSCFALLVSCKKRLPKKWDGTLVFSDDFHGSLLQKELWNWEDSCQGKGQKDTNLECFAKSDDNIRVINGSLVLKAIQEPWKSMQLFGKPKNFTSGRIRSIGPGFSHGSYIIRARMPKGKHLLPSIWLLPAYQDHDNCKYEEVDIVQARGQKTSTLIFSAHYGQRWNNVVTRVMEKSFPKVDFSEDFHEFAFVWKPRRMNWYVDGVMVFTAGTHFHTDWLLRDESNLPCGSNKSIFNQPLQLTLGMSVGGSMFPDVKYGNLTIREAHAWPKPTFEVDWVKVYQI